MHKAKSNKFIIAILAIFALVFSGLTFTVAPANAVTNGCISSGFQPQNCSTEKTKIDDIFAVINTAGYTTSGTVSGTCLSPTFALNKVTPKTSGNGYQLVAVSGNTVSGLTLSSSGGTVTFGGTTNGSTVANNEYIIMATCSGGAQEAFSFNLSVSSAATPIVTPSSQSVSGTVSTAISATASYSVRNFSGAPSFTVRTNVGDSALPAGLSLDATRGVVSGTPTAVSSVTIYIVASYNSETAEATITFDITAATPPPSGGSSEPDRKVTICHRTHAVTNPYVRITVDYNSVNKKSGHQGHDEIFAGQHVFAGAASYPRAKDKLWGDIIPPDPSGLNRWKPLNWFEGGKAIYESPTSVCPAYDPVKYYNQLRESGVPEKKIKAEIAELETEQSEAQPTKKTDTASLKYTGTDPKALEEENDKVTICHRTNSVTNPYRRITVAASSIYKTKGHYSHDEIYDGEHVFNSKVTYPNNQKDWGDIIPEDPSGKNRWKPLNMTTLGKQIYEGTVAGCAELTNEEFYNKLREDGLPKKEVKKDLEEQGNVDDDPKDVDDSHYTGNDPQVEKTEPKPPVQPEDKKPIAQSLSGIVWLDLNRDGLKDPDEPLMPKIVLSVVQVTSVTPANVRGSVRAAGLKATAVKPAAVVTVNTDANGYYEFPSLGAGDWKVVTGIPEDLSVTYDSQSLGDGEIIATVPVGSFAFTWVGLVGDNPTVDKKYIDEILKANPNALPKSELPTWYLAEVKAAKVAAAKKAAAAKAASINGRTELAFTGDNPWLEWLFSGLLLIAGLALSAYGLRKAKKSKA